MPEPTNHQDVIPSTPSVPNINSRWQRMRDWLISIVIIAVISIIVEKVFEHHSIEHVRQVNIAFAKGVEAVDPFRLAKIFYGYLCTGTPPESVKTYAFSQPVPTWSPIIVTFLWRAIPGAFYTAMTIISAGWVSVVTAAIALFLGYRSLRSRLKENLSALLVVPIVGCGFVWLLLQIMCLASVLFVRLIDGAEMVAASSVVVPAVAWAMGKKGEHDVTGKIFKWLTGHH